MENKFSEMLEKNPGNLRTENCLSNLHFSLSAVISIIDKIISAISEILLNHY